MEIGNSSQINNNETTTGISISDVKDTSNLDLSGLNGSNLSIGTLIVIIAGVMMWFLKYRKNTKVDTIIQNHDAKEHKINQEKNSKLVVELDKAADIKIDDIKKIDEKIENQVKQEQNIINKNADNIENRQDNNPSPSIKDTNDRINNLMKFFDN